MNRFQRSSQRTLSAAIALVVVGFFIISANRASAKLIPWPNSPAQPVHRTPPSQNVGPSTSNSASGVTVEDAFADPSPVGPQKLIASINDPNTRSIEMWMFSMSDQNVVNALVAAGERGAQVTIIFNAGMFTGRDSSVVSELSNSPNINVVQASAGFSITHAKTMIVNAGQPDAYAWIMSMNATTNYAEEADFAVKTSDSRVVSDLNNLFQLDLQNAQNSTALNLDGQEGRPSLTSPNLVVSPQNSLQKILDLINSAHSSIDMTVENIAYYPPTPKYPKPFEQIVNALIAKMRQGVRVRVITPGCDLNPWNPGYNMDALNALNQAASPMIVAKMMPYPASPTAPYMHQKLIIVDNSRFFIGSVNFSINSLKKAREIGVISKINGADRFVEQEFDQEFNEGVTPASSDRGIPRSCQAF